MKKLLLASLCITTIISFASCGSETAVEPTEETSAAPVEETKAEVDPITEKDFIVPTSILLLQLLKKQSCSPNHTLSSVARTVVIAIEKGFR